MKETPILTPYAISGVLSGLAGLSVFLILHQRWIMPIWFVLPLGSVIAAAGGWAVGWAYRELQPNLPPYPWTTLALIALIGWILTPALILAELRQPMFDISVPGGQLAMSTGQAILIFVLELLVTTTLVAGLTGWLIGRTRHALLATALAGFIFALGPGHNIPFIGGTPGVKTELALMGSTILVSAVVLVEASRRLLHLSK